MLLIYCISNFLLTQKRIFNISSSQEIVLIKYCKKIFSVGGWGIKATIMPYWSFYSKSIMADPQLHRWIISLWFLSVSTHNLVKSTGADTYYTLNLAVWFSLCHTCIHSCSVWLKKGLSYQILSLQCFWPSWLLADLQQGRQPEERWKKSDF